MDDIGNIIYLLVILASFVIGIWQNINKNKQKPSRQVEYEMEEDEIDSKQRRTEAVKEQRSFQQTVKEASAAARLKELENKAQEARLDRARRRKLVFEQSRESEAIELEEMEAERLEFDARKAVIYSEILKPPYL